MQGMHFVSRCFIIRPLCALTSSSTCTIKAWPCGPQTILRLNEQSATMLQHGSIVVLGSHCRGALHDGNMPGADSIGQPFEGGA